MEDYNYSADYRRDLVRTVTFRALDAARMTGRPE
jgi:hypothetical protein